MAGFSQTALARQTHENDLSATNSAGSNGYLEPPHLLKIHNLHGILKEYGVPTGCGEVAGVSTRVQIAIL